MGCI
jgi:NADPH-ferrihemoprotein reductase